MRVEVLLFGAEREAAGSDRAVVEVSHATCAGVREGLVRQHPVLVRFLGAARLAVNGEFAGEGQAIEAADEVALIGMVSGG